jgi:hypothetical protein
MAVDDFFAEMPLYRNFTENFNAINSTLPTNNMKIKVLSVEDFETKFLDILLTSKNDTFKSSSRQFWSQLFQDNFVGTGQSNLFFLFLSMILLTRDLNESNFFKAVHRFYETIEIPQINKEKDILYSQLSFLQEFVSFYYNLLTTKAIPFVMNTFPEPEECKKNLNELYEKKKIFLYVKELIAKLDEKGEFVEFTKFYKLIPLKGNEVRDLIAKRPKVDN